MLFFGSVRRDLIAGGLLFGISILIYADTTSFGFQEIWDDGVYVLNNPFVRGMGLQYLEGIFNRPYEGLYGPIQMVSYMLDYQVWGYDPFGFHLTNVLLHALNAVLVFVVLRALVPDFAIAFFAALMFAIHPMNVENVAWIAERKTLVSSFFLLLSLYCYLRFRTEGAGRIGSYCVAVVFYTLSAFAKATVVGFPAILVFYELLMREKNDRAFRPILPFLVVSLAAAGTTLWATTVTGVIARGSELDAEFLFGMAYPTVVPVWWEYLRLLVIPDRLSAFYIAEIRTSFLDPIVLAASIAWILVVATVFRGSSKAIKFWFLWAVALFSPTSGILPWVVYYADRYVYLPALGLYVIVGMSVAWAYTLATKRFPALARAKDGMLAVALLAVTVVYGTLAYQRTAVWATEISLWEDTVVKSPDFSGGYINLGLAYVKEGNYDSAERAFLSAARLGNPKGGALLFRVRQQRDQDEAEGE